MPAPEGPPSAAQDLPRSPPQESRVNALGGLRIAPSSANFLWLDLLLQHAGARGAGAVRPHAHSLERRGPPDLHPGFRSARTRTTGRLRKAWWSCCAAACTCWAWHLGRVDGRGRAGSRYRLLLVVRLAHFRLPSSGCPAVRVAPGPVRTCAAAIATALRRWRRARRREPHGSQRAAEVRDNRRTRPPHDGQNAGLHD